MPSTKKYIGMFVLLLIFSAFISGFIEVSIGINLNIVPISFSLFAVYYGFTNKNRIKNGESRAWVFLIFFVVFGFLIFMGMLYSWGVFGGMSQPLCYEENISVGNRCCLDQNNNRICDSYDISKEKENSTEMAPNKYNNKRYEFSMKYPRNWTIEENSTSGNVTTIVAFIGPTEIIFKPNIAVKTDRLDEYSFENYILANKEGISQNYMMTNYTLVGEGELNISRDRTYFLEFTGNYGGITIRQRQVYVKNKNRVYVLAYTSSKNNFWKYRDEFEECINSVKINHA